MRRKYDKKSNIPAMTLRVEIYEECRVKIDSTMAGYHWIMHNRDEDINTPSCPHCHAIDAPGNYKLNIYTGEYFEYPGATYKGKITKQEMKRMWKQKDFVENVIRERIWYEEEYYKTNPERYPKLPTLPITMKHSKSTLKVTLKWINNNKRRNSYLYRIR